MLNLCEREQIIIKLIKEGFTFSEIAGKLKLSHRTIGFLVAEIKCKVENAGGSLAQLLED